MYLDDIVHRKTMHTQDTNIRIWRTRRHKLRNSLTSLVEAVTWTACLHITARTTGYQHENWHIFLALAFLLYLVAVQFIPANTFSRTTRRDEVVACAIKTALTTCILAAAVFAQHFLPGITGLLFCMVLTIERLIANNCFIRYCIQPAHNEHGILICQREDAASFLQALQQNTYGLTLNCMERDSTSSEQTTMVQRLEEYLSAHKETTSVYCALSALSATETEAMAYTCRKQGIVLHLLPLPTNVMNPLVRNECRGTICVLSPAKHPLCNPANRIAKRMTDIVLSLIVLLTIFPPVALVVFICSKRQSRGPILTSRHMCGMNGKPFQSLTFRTRHYNAAPSFLDGLDDPGYFPFGRFLSRTRLEMLPQFLCVLWGSMSIVGSQAMTPEQYADYRHELQRRFASGYRLKAGIINYHFPYHAGNSPEADVWYCRNWSFWLDIRTMFRRTGTLLSRSKAKSIHYI